MQTLPLAAIYFMTHKEYQVCYFPYFITSVSLTAFLLCMQFSIAVFYFFAHSSYLFNYSCQDYAEEEGWGDDVGSRQGLAVSLYVPWEVSDPSSWCIIN